MLNFVCVQLPLTVCYGQFTYPVFPAAPLIETFAKT